MIYFALLIAAAALSGWWVYKGLRDGEMWLFMFLKAHRRDQPSLFWLAIWSQSLTTFAVIGIAAAMLWWSRHPT